MNQLWAVLLFCYNLQCQVFDFFLYNPKVQELTKKENAELITLKRVQFFFFPIL
jgi:hypothetical protein